MRGLGEGVLRIYGELMEAFSGCEWVDVYFEMHLLMGMSLGDCPDEGEYSGIEGWG